MQEATSRFRKPVGPGTWAVLGCGWLLGATSGCGGPPDGGMPETPPATQAESDAVAERIKADRPPGLVEKGRGR